MGATPSFRTRRQRHIAALLLVRPMSLSELLGLVGGDKTTLRRGLDSLRDQGLLTYVSSEDGQAAPGRPAGLWALTDLGLAAAGGDSKALSGDDQPTESPVATVALGQYQAGVI